jgi:hypothetical protein
MHSTKENTMSTQETTQAETPKKAKADKKSAKATNPAKTKKAAKSTKPKGTKSGSKAERVLELMKRKEGATLAKIAKATDWQNHSVRGFVSRHLIKKVGSRSSPRRARSGCSVPDYGLAGF